MLGENATDRITLRRMIVIIIITILAGKILSKDFDEKTPDNNLL